MTGQIIFDQHAKFRNTLLAETFAGFLNRVIELGTTACEGRWRYKPRNVRLSHAMEVWRGGG